MAVPTITLPIDAPALSRGVGFFETLWVTGGRAVFFDEHFARLRSSCEMLGVPVPPLSLVRSRVRAALLRARKGGEHGLRWSYLAAGRDLDDPRSWKFFALLFPVPPEILRKRRGVRAILLPREWERTTPRWKTIDYRASIAGVRLAKGLSAEEGIFLDAKGRVREGTMSNVFALSGDRALTPPVSAGLLAGIVRGWVIANAGRVGMKVEEKRFSPARLRRGAFLTSSLTGIAALKTLDGEPCSRPPAALSRLRELYLDEARNGGI